MSTYNGPRPPHARPDCSLSRGARALSAMEAVSDEEAPMAVPTSGDAPPSFRPEELPIRGRLSVKEFWEAIGPS